MKHFVAVAVLYLLFFLPLHAQQEVVESKVEGEEFAHWHLKDLNNDGHFGISSEKTYTELLKGRTSQTVIVAVIDSGTDIEHEDLQANIWVNEDEIPGNGIDDDKNGYIDDVHGWSFLGNTDGENINQENMEVTRVYTKYKKEFAGLSRSAVSTERRETFDMWQRCKAEMEAERKAAEDELTQLGEFAQVLSAVHFIIARELGTEEYTIDDIKGIKSQDEAVAASRDLMIQLHEDDFKPEDIVEWQEDVDRRLKYAYNPDYNVRAMIVGDDPDDMNERDYGCPDVRGPRADHGTHVSGIVGAIHDNDLGMEGVARDVKIMPLRAVPHGDELDKDVANAIRYAVENGAQIINMSFGKGISPNKEAVDAAVKFAEEKGVLLVHGAGNDAENVDKVENFPNPNYLAGGKASNWLEVGAIQQERGAEMMATFTNYGKTNVDLYAPGVDIFSLKPDDTYKNNSGTSMASPVVAGAAALIWSYFPELSASELKELLMSTATRERIRVAVPGTANKNGKFKKKCFKKLSASGGIVNVYAAVQEALKRN